MSSFCFAQGSHLVSEHGCTDFTDLKKSVGHEEIREKRRHSYYRQAGQVWRGQLWLVGFLIDEAIFPSSGENGA